MKSLRRAVRNTISPDSERPNARGTGADRWRVAARTRWVRTLESNCNRICVRTHTLNDMVSVELLLCELPVIVCGCVSCSKINAHEGQSKSGPCRSLFSSLMGSPAEGLRCAGVWLLVTGILGGMLLPSGPLCAPATTLSRSSNSLPQPSMETHPHRSATCLLSRGLYRRMHPRLLLERR